MAGDVVQASVSQRLGQRFAAMGQPHSHPRDRVEPAAEKPHTACYTARDISNARDTGAKTPAGPS